MTTTSPVPAARTWANSRLTVLGTCLCLLLALAACSGTRERVTIMVPWTQQAEFQTFYSLVKDFEDDTGIEVDVQVTRALTQQLDAAVTAGAPPDLAVLPSPAAVARYAGRSGGLRALDRHGDGGGDENIVDITDYLQPFQGLSRVAGTAYAVPVKVDVKSLVWYDSRTTSAPAAGAASASGRGAGVPSGLPWCLGLESGPTSGWPGADWIADVLLAGAGPDAYARWVSGDLPWTAGQVEQAWQHWRGLVGAKVLDGAAQRGFAEATQDLAGASPDCRLAHGARSALATDVQQDTRLDFTAPAGRGPLQVSGDFVGMFTAHNAAAKSFVRYLAGQQAQQAWVNEKGAVALSAHKRVTRYDNAVQRRIAELLRPQARRPQCFSAADVLSPDVSAAFYRAVIEYVDQPDQLTHLMQSLQKVQANLGGSALPRQSVCTVPK
jgi:alpha-glucoside transport system substrate-binding protein